MISRSLRDFDVNLCNKSGSPNFPTNKNKLDATLFSTPISDWNRYLICALIWGGQIGYICAQSSHPLTKILTYCRPVTLILITLTIEKLSKKNDISARKSYFHRVSWGARSERATDRDLVTRWNPYIFYPRPHRDFFRLTWIVTRDTSPMSVFSNIMIGPARSLLRSYSSRNKRTTL